MNAFLALYIALGIHVPSNVFAATPNVKLLSYRLARLAKMEGAARMLPLDSCMTHHLARSSHHLYFSHS
jgi:hypothetical protein